MRDIHDEYPNLSIADIESINLGVIKAGAALISEPAERILVVKTSVDAQFNMAFGAAVALATGQATVDQFDDAAVVAAELHEWMGKVNLALND